MSGKGVTMDRQFLQYDEETLRRLQQTLLEIFTDFAAACEKYNLRYFMFAGSGIGVVRHQGFIPWDDDIDVAMPREDYDKLLEIAPREWAGKYKITTPLTDCQYISAVTKMQKLGTKFVPEMSKDMKCDLCIAIDIFPYDNAPENPFLQKKQLWITCFLTKLIFLRGNPHPIIPLKGWKKTVSKRICEFAHFLTAAIHLSPRFLYRCLLRESTRYNGKETARMSTFVDAVPQKSYVMRGELYPLIDMPFENTTAKMPNQYDVCLQRIFGDYMQLPPESKRVNHCPYILDFGVQNEADSH